ncbi:disintegrin and metallo ase domain-containing 8-like protein [Labeo rohita]|uniref:Disintegrin and metallo ase domain-containing 8-like protein n=1 Tax=Labeo rohita TaxID=84645 RepID=A0A498MFK4_LABRO|nr:disintegrin and metallo ase domain-containing 8-like protein [Labeo rohita]
MYKAIVVFLKSEALVNQLTDHCYYQGHVHNFEDSSVSVGLCSGMEGFLRIKNQVYLIEPLEESLDGDHAIYKQEHLRTKQGAFGYINDTVYNFGPKASGLYKGKYMKNTGGGQQVVEMVLVVDNTEYKKFGCFKKIEERMLLVANHVDKDHNKNPIAVASTITHEMGHNLGMSHDDSSCGCSSNKGCVMSDTIGYVYPDSFSTCSQAALKAFLQNHDTRCLLDVPNESKLYGGPVCGNAFVEKGEDCDCGTVEECNNPCCNATTCRLTEGAVCAHGECCHNCQLKHSSSLCRKSAHDCDLDEYCTGISAFCPEDEYKMNGIPCNYNQGYCYNGQCPTHKEHCKTLWGADAKVDADTCFGYNVRDGTSKSAEHMMCGKIYCYGGNPFPITNKRLTVTIGSKTCNMAVDDSATDDLGMVPAGTKCGINKASVLPQPLPKH